MTPRPNRTAPAAARKGNGQARPEFQALLIGRKKDNDLLLGRRIMPGCGQLVPEQLPWRGPTKAGPIGSQRRSRPRLRLGTIACCRSWGFHGAGGGLSTVSRRDAGGGFYLCASKAGFLPRMSKGPAADPGGLAKTMGSSKGSVFPSSPSSMNGGRLGPPCG